MMIIKFFFLQKKQVFEQIIHMKIISVKNMIFIRLDLHIWQRNDVHDNNTNLFSWSFIVIITHTKTKTPYFGE